MKHLWTVYQYACKDCGAFLAEPRVPSDRSVTEYRPDGCFKCGSTNISERIKP